MAPRTLRLGHRSLLGLILVLFLMPFVSLTCGGATFATFNGAQLVLGAKIEKKDPFSGRITREILKPEPLALVAALGAAVGLALAFAASKKLRIVSGAASSLTALALLLLKFRMEQQALQKGEGLLGVSWEFGFWLALLAALAASALAFLPERRDAGGPPNPGGPPSA